MDIKDKAYVKIYKEIEYLRLHRKEEKNSEVYEERKVSKEEVENYLKLKKKNSSELGMATFIAFISPIPLYLIIGLNFEGIYKGLLFVLGMFLLTIFLLISIIIYFNSNKKLMDFKFLYQERFVLDDKTTDFVIDELLIFEKKTYKNLELLASLMFILGIFPLIFGLLYRSISPLFLTSMLALMLIFLALGLALAIIGKVEDNSYRRLLGLTKDNNTYPLEKFKNTFTSFYFILTFAIYLSISILTRAWKYTWMMLILCGILYPILIFFINFLKKKKD